MASRPRVVRPGKGEPSLAETVFKAHLTELSRHIDRNGVAGLEPMYRAARAELADRLRRYRTDDDRVDPLSLRAMIAQTDAVLATLGGELDRHLKNQARAAVELGARHGTREFKALATRFEGTTPVLQVEAPAIFAGLARDVDRSLLRRHEARSKTWTIDAIGTVEQKLTVSSMTLKPLEEVIDDVQAALGSVRWKAERIVRTEMAYAHGAAKLETILRTEKELGTPVYKMLVSALDDRSGDDSILIHGQMVPAAQPFSWKHYSKARGWVLEQFMHPPNRPNDRAVVIPWDPEWDVTELERPLTLGELRAYPPTRWRKKAGIKIPPGHKPGRPYTGKAAKGPAGPAAPPAPIVDDEAEQRERERIERERVEREQAEAARRKAEAEAARKAEAEAARKAAEAKREAEARAAAQAAAQATTASSPPDGRATPGATAWMPPEYETMKWTMPELRPTGVVNESALSAALTQRAKESRANVLNRDAVASQRTVRKELGEYLAQYRLIDRDLTSGNLRGASELFLDDYSMAGAHATHDWSGRIELSPATSEGIAMFAKGDRSPDAQASMKTLLHEQVHGASPVSAGGYHSIGKVIEEATNEIVTRKIFREQFPNVEPLRALDPGTQYVSKLTRQAISRGRRKERPFPRTIGTYQDWIVEVANTIVRTGILDPALKAPGMTPAAGRAHLSDFMEKVSFMFKAGSKRELSSSDAVVDYFLEIVLDAAGKKGAKDEGDWRKALKLGFDSNMLRYMGK